MCSCRLRQIRAGWGGSPSREGHVGRTTLQLVACAPAPPRQALGAWGQVGVLASSVLSSLALLEQYSIKDTAAGWNAEGQAWPPPVSEPLCPGVLDLPRRVQRRQRETSWSRSLAPSPPLPKPSPALAAVVPRLSLAAAPTWARRLWIFATRRLGILQQSLGGLGRNSGLPWLSTVPLPQVKPRRQEKKMSSVSSVCGTYCVRDRAPVPPSLWPAVLTSIRTITHSPLCPWD